MKKILVTMLISLCVLSGCGKKAECSANNIKVCGSYWGHYVYEYYDEDTGVTYLCTNDGGITPKVNSNDYVYESNR